MTVKIRKGLEKDLIEVLELIKELALFEKAPDEVTLTIEEFTRDFKREDPKFKIFVAEEEKEIIGMALYFFTYSTWKGKCLYLEDIVVKAEKRREGVGNALFKALIKEAKESNVKRFAWQVLDWNNSAIEFYKKWNANLEEEWINCKLTSQQLHK